MQEHKSPQYNTGSNLQQIKVSLSPQLLDKLDSNRAKLAEQLGVPSVSRSLALSQILSQANQAGLL